MIRRRLGWPSTDSSVSDAELRDMLRESQRELHDFLTVTYGDEYRVLTQTIATTAGISGYTMTSVSRVHRLATRFSSRSVPFRRVQLQSETMDHTSTTWEEGTDFSYRLTRHTDVNGDPTTLLWVYPVPSAAYVMRLVYTASPATLSLSTAINTLGFDEYLALDVMIKLRNMEEIDASDLVQKLERLKQQIQTDAPPLDMGQPQVINDARSTHGGRWP
jgi:hypothetical protein